MSYTVKISPQVKKFLEKAEKKLSDRIKKKFRFLKNDPFRYLESYENEDFYKLRIGMHRALIDIDRSRKIVLVRYLDHRKEFTNENDQNLINRTNQTVEFFPPYFGIL